MDDVQKDMDTLMGDDKHKTNVTSDNVRVSEDVPRPLPSPVPKSPTQSHTSAEKIVEVTNEEQHILWEEYGLRLHIPQNALPEDLDHWQLKIAVFLSRYFKLPEDGVLVSAVYSFSHNLGDRKLRNSVTLEIQHCAMNKRLSDLRIVRASSRAEDPLKFEIIPGGIFEPDTGYGVIKLDQFCSISCWLWRRFCSVFLELKYFARLYYTDIQYQSFCSDLYILPNYNTCFKV